MEGVRKLYSIRAAIEEVFRILKQACGWQGVQQRQIKTYTQHLTFTCKGSKYRPVLVFMYCVAGSLLAS
ncbi:hypothetical protein J3L12_14880 [Meiothermus sp. CFH 77666]|nr:hypothetical protein [Meiothermus sp. CFH 77666]